ncbi:MAG: MlaD family protein [Ignavibacteria bacterium]|nr:MlaD family protein [Ignavibacteria bacterium]
MNETKRNLAIGIFTMAGLALLIFVIFFISKNRNLFTTSLHLKTYFENVAGLQKGTKVTFSGIGIGSVYEINIISGDKIEVVLDVTTDIQKYIKTDSKVVIISEGLVGNRIVEISAGSSSAPSVENNSIIESVKPISAEDILKSLKETGDNASKLSKDLADITGRVNKGEGTIGQLLKSDSLYYSVKNVMASFAVYSKDLNRIFSSLGSAIDNISGDFGKLTKELDKTVGNLSEITGKLNSSESFIGTLLTDTSFANNLKGTIESANKTTKNLEKGAFSFNQNMEALKHNFFFKGYFEDIGYWDKETYEIESERRLSQLRDAHMKLDSLQRIIEKKEKELKKE